MYDSTPLNHETACLPDLGDGGVFPVDRLSAAQLFPDRPSVASDDPMGHGLTC